MQIYRNIKDNLIKFFIKNMLFYLYFTASKTLKWNVSYVEASFNEIREN